MDLFSLDDFLPGYPSLGEENFSGQIAVRREFSELSTGFEEEQKSRVQGALFKTQLVIKRFLSDKTDFDELALIHDVGVGKTCAAIAVSELYKMKTLGEADKTKLQSSGERPPRGIGTERALVLMKNNELVRNFKQQLFDICTPEGTYSAVNKSTGAKIKETQKMRTTGAKPWYEIDTFESFKRKLDAMNEAEVEKAYSDRVIIIDEAHNVRNPKKGSYDEYANLKITKEDRKARSLRKSGPDDGKKEEQDVVIPGIYDQILKLSRSTKRRKLLLLTATPIVDDVDEARTFLNLLLPASMALPDTVDMTRVTLAEMEPLFRGRFSYIKGSKAIPRKIEEGKLVVFENVAPESDKEVEEEKEEKKGVQPIEYSEGRQAEKVPREEAPKVSSVPQGLEEETEEKAQDTESRVEPPSGRRERARYSMYLAPCPMSKTQYEAYVSASSKPGKFRRHQIHASGFVFPKDLTPKEEWKGKLSWPDHYYGSAAISRFMEIKHPPKDERKRGGKGTGKTSIVTFSDKRMMTRYLKLKDPEGEDQGLRNWSCKFADTVEQVNEGKDETAFLYNEFVGPSGCYLLGKCFEANGYKEFKTDGDLTPGVLRYAVITSKSTLAYRDTALEIFKRPENKNGALIKVIIGSKVIKEGISMKNVRQAHVMFPSWNNTAIYQATGRVFRERSHDDLPPPGRYAKVWRHMSIVRRGGKDYPLIDYSLYRLSFVKEYFALRILNMMKVCAFDCYLFKRRNLPRLRAPPGQTVENFDRDCDYQECDYKCVGSEVGADGKELVLPPEDTSTFRLYYADKKEIIGQTESAIEQIKRWVKRLFKQAPSYSFKEIKDLLLSGETDGKLILMALDEIIKYSEPIRDKFGFVGYLREEKDTYFLQRNYSVKPDFSLVEESSKGFAFFPSSLNEIVTSAGDIEEEDVLADLCEVQLEGEKQTERKKKFLEDFHKLSPLTKGAFIESILELKAEGRESSPEQKWKVDLVMARYANRIFRVEDQWVHTMLSTAAIGNKHGDIKHALAPKVLRILKVYPDRLEWVTHEAEEKKKDAFADAVKKELGERQLAFGNRFRIDFVDEKGERKQAALYGILLDNGSFKIRDGRTQGEVKMKKDNKGIDQRSIKEGKECINREPPEIADMLIQTNAVTPRGRLPSLSEMTNFLLEEYPKVKWKSHGEAYIRSAYYILETYNKKEDLCELLQTSWDAQERIFKL